MRENNVVESYKSLIENRNRLADIHENAVKEAADKRQRFVNEYHNILESREMKQRRHGQFMESCRNDALAKSIKAIYITALEAGTLTDNGLLLAESMVDNWIKENGGASKILGECQNKTYLLARISQIVEEAAILETEELEKIDKEEIDTDEDTTPDDVSEDTTEGEDEVSLATKVIEKNLDTEDEEVAKALEIIKKKSGQAQSEDKDDDDDHDDDDKEDDHDKDDKDDDDDHDKDDKDDHDDDDDKDDDHDKDDSDDLAGDPLNDTFDDEDSKGGDGEAKEEDANDGTSDSTESQPVSDKSDDKDDSESKDEPTEDEDKNADADDLAGDPLNDTFDDDEDSKDVEVPDDGEAEDSDEDSEETDVADDIVDDLDDTPEEDITVDGGTSNDGKVFDELEKEDDVKKAIEVIRQRVADAEETFIKRNAEDKKAIDDLIGKISDNVKTVEDISNNDSGESKVAAESARLYKQKINEITENRPLTVMEKMTRIIHSNVVKNQVVKESYSNEDGSLDTGLIVESAKVMYGFLETLNTLQLEKVDAKYIENVLNNMK